LPYSKATLLIVVNDELAEDKLRQEIIHLAVPQNIHLCFYPLHRVLDSVHPTNDETPCRDVFMLFASCADAKKAFEYGLHFEFLNIGNIHYAPGKKQVCDHIALSKEDIHCLSFFEKKGIKLDFRCVPNKEVQIKKFR
jgi:PTS system mannose-specific IIB component